MTVDVLGTTYEIVVKKYDEDDYFERNEASGYCSSLEREIGLCDMATYPGFENETEAIRSGQTKLTLRHEIVHAFLSESGLSANSNASDCWARNEEMVDWFAVQGPKIYHAWAAAGAM